MTKKKESKEPDQDDMEFDDDADMELDEDIEEEEEETPAPVVRKRIKKAVVIEAVAEPTKLETVEELRARLDELLHKQESEKFNATLPPRIDAIEKAINDDRKHLVNHHKRLNSLEANFKLLNEK